MAEKTTFITKEKSAEILEITPRKLREKVREGSLAIRYRCRQRGTGKYSTAYQYCLEDINALFTVIDNRDRK